MKLLIYTIHAAHVYVVGSYHCWLWVCCQPCACWLCACRKTSYCWHWMSGRMTQYLFQKWHCWYLYNSAYSSFSLCQTRKSGFGAKNWLASDLCKNYQCKVHALCQGMISWAPLVCALSQAYFYAHCLLERTYQYHNTQEHQVLLYVMLSTHKVLTQSEHVLSLCSDRNVRDLWVALAIHPRLKISLAQHFLTLLAYQIQKWSYFMQAITICIFCIISSILIDMQKSQIDFETIPWHNFWKVWRIVKFVLWPAWIYVGFVNNTHLNYQSNETWSSFTVRSVQFLR